MRESTKILLVSKGVKTRREVDKIDTLEQTVWYGILGLVCVIFSFIVPSPPKTETGLDLFLLILGGVLMFLSGCIFFGSTYWSTSWECIKKLKEGK
jgi:hypothetical protein